MSFYGNVYYQFIDTFYKVIFHNTDFDGEQVPEFPTQDQIKEKDSVQAIGRQGVIDLNPGNRWIQFTKDEQDGRIKIWHGKPVNTETNRDGLLYGIGSVVKFDSPNPPEVFTPLNEGDYIWTSAAYYDTAGHIINNPDEDGNFGKYQTCYKLPKSENSTKTDNLIKITGGLNINTGEIITTDFNETNTIIKQVIQNKNDISDNDTTVKNLIDGNDNRIKVLEDLYSDNSNNLFSVTRKEDDSNYIPEDKNFPKTFGKIPDILAVWNNFIDNNDYIKQYLLKDDLLIQYFTVKDEDIVVKDISTAICLITGTIKALKKNLEDTISVTQGDVNSAKDLANTAMDALGEYGDDDKSVFNAKRTIADAFGRRDDGLCYFNSENTVRNSIEMLDDKIIEKENALNADIQKINNNKVNNSDFNNYKTTIYTKTEVDNLLSTKVNNNTLNSYYNKEEINTSLSTKVDNTDLDNYYNKGDINGIIKSLEDKISTLEEEINTLKSYHSNENVENPEDGE